MNILTFDIEDWYCRDMANSDREWEKKEVRIYEGVDMILSALEKKGTKGTFFCLGWLAEHHPAVIKQIADAGHQIGCHSYQHDVATRFTPKEFKQDTYRAKSLLEDVSGKPVELFRAPAFSVTKNNLFVFEVLSELGFTTDCSIFPANRDDGGMPSYGSVEPSVIEYNGISIKEFPIHPFSIAGRNIVYSGGGYFRLFPYWLIKYLTQKQDYVMSYFHTADFDVNQPPLDYLPKWNQLKCSIGLKGAYKKFENYLSDFDFINIEQADALIDWQTCKKVVL